MGILYSYIITRDFGFAPNPFWGMCTLSTCKPGIRKHSDIGDYLIGFGGKKTSVSGKVIFVMKVEEKISYIDYWNDPRFKNKKPNLYGSLKTQYGDNIYHKVNSSWIQMNSHHSNNDGTTNNNLKKDTGAPIVLISQNDWWYFGKNAITLPNEFSDFKSPRNYRKLDENRLYAFLKWFELKYIEKGRHGNPEKWEGIKNGKIKDIKE